MSISIIPKNMNKENEKRYRVNEQIRISPVVVINQEGRNMGSLPLQKAMSIALESDLDLVEISPDSRPPICRIMDFGKFKFDQGIKEKAQKKNQKSQQPKEIRLSPSIQKHDLETKVKSAKKFIQDGHRVNIKLEFRRREIAHTELGREVMSSFLLEMGETCELAGGMKMEGKALFCSVVPKDKGKTN